MLTRVDGRVCAVVGGGAIGGRRAESLAAAGALVRLIAPELGATAAAAMANGDIADHRARPFAPDDLDGCHLVVAATDSRAVNADVLAAARARGIPCNVVDDPHAGDFIIPATLRRGALTIAVSTDGASPVVAADIRTRLEGTFGPEWADLLALLDDLRDDLKRRHPDPGSRAARVRAVLDSDVREMLARGDGSAAQRRARVLLELGD